MKYTVAGTLVSTLVLALGFAVPASAQAPAGMSPAKMKCEDFSPVESTYQPTLVYWAAGVDKLGVSETDTMVVDTAKPVAVIVASARRHPRHRHEEGS